MQNCVASVTNKQTHFRHWKFTFKIQFWHFLYRSQTYLGTLIIWEVAKGVADEVHDFSPDAALHHSEGMAPKVSGLFLCVAGLLHSVRTSVAPCFEWMGCQRCRWRGSWLYSWCGLYTARKEWLQRLAAFFCVCGRDIHIECSKQFKWNLYFYLSGLSRPFWAVLKLL